jgi:hypothetical protein
VRSSLVVLGALQLPQQLEGMLQANGGDVVNDRRALRRTADVAGGSGAGWNRGESGAQRDTMGGRWDMARAVDETAMGVRLRLRRHMR